MEPIQFFLPETEEVFARLPSTVGEYWDWQATATGLFPYWGRYHWVLQTFLYLKDAGLPVRLARTLPEAGIIATHMDCVDYGFRPNREQILVIMLVDREVPHPHAHLHITHNPVQGLPWGIRHRYMPPWPQIGLIPRDARRGDSFETIGYFGYENNLDPAIRDAGFQQGLKDLGVRLEIPPPSSWHDFSQVDAILAIRNFGRGNPLLSKPSLKLYNAWLAGVPAIFGYESSYRAEGEPGRAYLEAVSPEQVLASIEQLKNDLVFRRSLVSRGQALVEQYRPESTVGRWASLLAADVNELASRYPRSAASRLIKDTRGTVLERILWRRPGAFSQRRA